MQFVIDELQKSLRYHTRQLEDNIRDIDSKKEAIESLLSRNLRHEQAIEEINLHLDQLEKTEKAAT